MMKKTDKYTLTHDERLSWWQPIQKRAHPKFHIEHRKLNNKGKKLTVGNIVQRSNYNNDDNDDVKKNFTKYQRTE